eukprot:886293-Amphidinium_carterae.1
MADHAWSACYVRMDPFQEHSAVHSAWSRHASLGTLVKSCGHLLAAEVCTGCGDGDFPNDDVSPLTAAAA